MKTREEVAEFVRKQMHWSYKGQDREQYCKKYCTHYGWVELKELMDFLYGGPPTNKEQELYELDFNTKF